MPGLGLLLLRAAVGGVLIAQGAYGPGSTSVFPLLEVLIGISVLLGFMTPIAGVLATLVNAGMALSWLPQSTLRVVETKQALVIVAVMATALAFLGPGAFSIDSILFGRREIVIPRVTRPPED